MPPRRPSARSASSSPADDERRRRGRIELQGLVRLRPEEGWGVDSVAATALNISSTGLFVASDEPGRVGQRLHCEMAFTPRAPLDVSCRVVWVRGTADSGGPAGMGLAFEDLTDTRSERLQRLLGRLGHDSASTFLAVDPFAESGTWAPREQLEEPAAPPLPFAIKLALVLSVIVVLGLLAVIALLLSG